jgi:hypothetical protein
MAHIGRKWPYAKFRDLWINNQPPYGIHRNWRWRGNGSMAGTLGGGWGQHAISEDGVPDYANGLVTWEWLPPAEANSHTRWWLQMFLIHDPPYVLNRFRIWISYDSYVSSFRTMALSIYTADRFIGNCGFPGLTVPGIGTLQSLVAELEGVRWIDYPAEHP